MSQLGKRVLGSSERSWPRWRRSFRGRLCFDAILFLFGMSIAIWASRADADEQVLLSGAGSTFSAPLYKKWIDEYSVSHHNISITYDAVGRGVGIKRFLGETVDFAGSDEV